MPTRSSTMRPSGRYTTSTAPWACMWPISSGEESVKYYFLMSKCWFKGLVVCCSIFSCCFCCFCCCCCCGKCKPPEEDEDYVYVDPEDLEAQIRQEQEAGGVPIIIAQPMPSSATEVSGPNAAIAIQPHSTAKELNHSDDGLP
ncbi:hypothetical protein AGOR_G00109450 [Albula goreensis]|uniref:Uncharacterized protein n=1 Tax=Albula goreensis TaxID=1534307 RepID=A0A8T3DI49_9TELE|nr:hypothetical protein AGOR_G00109450 [Albula goreensis]